MLRHTIMISCLLICFPALSADIPHGSRATTKFAASNPESWHRFCARYKGECETPIDARYEIRLDAARLGMMARVNQEVNSTISYITDREHWGVEERYDLPNDGKGDCEDIALQKRHLLIKAGFPARALLLTIVEWRGNGHAVLTAITDHGDMLLDNHSDLILTLDDIGYKLIQRQDPNFLARWKRFEP